LTGLWWLTGSDPFEIVTTPDPSTHGTYQRARYFLVIARSVPSVQPAPADTRHKDPKQPPPPPPPSEVHYAQLLVFDENGDFGRFEWNADYTTWNGLKGAWVSHNEPFAFTADAEVLPPSGDSLTLPPVLCIQKPDGGHACPLPQGGSLLEVDLSQPVPPRVGLPTEYISFDPAAKTNFDWVQPRAAGGMTRLVFERLKPTDSQAGAGDATWDSMFRNSYKLNGALFVGYKPRELDLYQGRITGTDCAAGRYPGQDLPGAPIFAYPELTSRDYVKSQSGEAKVLPLGAHWVSIDSEKENELTQVITTERERTQVTSLSLGLSGGIKGLANGKVGGSFESSTTTGETLETRYSLSVKTGKSYALIADGPNRRLDPVFKAQLLAYLQTYYRLGKTLSDEVWHGLQREYGSHYANAVTFGSISRLQTRLTARTELSAATQKVSINDEAKVAFDKFLSAGSNAAASFQWGDKLSTSIDVSDKTGFGLGTDPHEGPAPISLDLRPISEVLSPLFFDYDPNPAARNECIAAPFIWYRLRRSLQAYLKSKYLDQLPDTLNRDYTPKVMTLTFPYLNVTCENDWPEMYGTITFTLIGDPEKVAMVSQGFDVSASNCQSIGNGSNLPGYDQLYCTIAAPLDEFAKGAGARVTGSLNNWHALEAADHIDVNFDAPMNSPPPPQMTYSTVGMVGGEVSCIIYINLQYKWTEVDVPGGAPPS
jgi:hypothetical protein